MRWSIKTEGGLYPPFASLGIYCFFMVISTMVFATIGGFFLLTPHTVAVAGCGGFPAFALYQGFEWFAFDNPLGPTGSTPESWF